MAHLRVWHTGGGVEGVQLVTEGAAGVARKAHGIGKRTLHGFLLELTLHATMVLALHLDAVLDAPLGIPEGPVFQLGHQLGIESRLLGGDGVQVTHTVHVALGGGHVQGRVVVVV